MSIIFDDTKLLSLSLSISVPVVAKVQLQRITRTTTTYITKEKERKQKMLIPLVFIAAAHLINACFSTRLPLEVYELTPPHSPAGVTAQAAAASVAVATDLKYKNLEYATINAAAASVISKASSLDSSEDIDLKILSQKDEAQQQQQQQQLDRRRSRQMLDLLKTHHEYEHKFHTLQVTTNGGLTGDISVNVGHHSLKDVRILYQVGVSICVFFSFFLVYFDPNNEYV